MNDSTPMPFGKHKGTPLANVPDSYLLWFWNENKAAYESGELTGYNNVRLMDYIKDSFEESAL